MSDQMRPLSPHLQIYKPQLTSVLSILHRATGVFLMIGTGLLCWWLYSLSSGPETYKCFRDFMNCWIGTLFLFGWTFSLMYHLLNGIRHLFWDAGYGLELSCTYKSGWIVVGLTILSTAALTFFAWTL